MFGNKVTITFVDFALFLSTFQAHSLKTSNELKNVMMDKKLRCKFNNKYVQMRLVVLLLLSHLGSLYYRL